MRIPKLAEELNKEASNYEIGGLQNIRVKLKSLLRAPSKCIFNTQTIHEYYAFHVGGRHELQFNIGEEEHNGTKTYRHGVAFSLSLSRSLPSIEPLIPKILRFNEYIRSNLEEFQNFKMWYYDSANRRSEDTPIAPLTEDLITVGTFIMLGRWIPINGIRAHEILSDFDQLLPLYIYVENQDAKALDCFKSDFVPGCPMFLKRTIANYKKGTININLRHKMIQQKLYDCLCREFGKENVRIEHPLENGMRVDAAVQEGKKLVFYEVKAASSAQSCVRQAMGQLLEYTYWPLADRAHEIIVVGESKLDNNTEAYMGLLRERFSIPIWYRSINIDRGILAAKK